MNENNPLVCGLILLIENLDTVSLHQQNIPKSFKPSNQNCHIFFSHETFKMINNEKKFLCVVSI